MFLHWYKGRIANTAIRANNASLSIGLTHYYDLERQCRDCNRMFIFYAAEQKYWYEVLCFPLDSDCVRCYPCRKKQQKLARAFHQYDFLLHCAERTAQQSLTMIECCLDLIESHRFSLQKLQWIRQLLKTLPVELAVPCKKKKHRPNHVASDLPYNQRLEIIKQRIKDLTIEP